MHRILLLANLNPNKLGSMEEHALSLSRELKKRGHICYLGFIVEPEAAIKQLFEESGARIVTANYDDRPVYRDIVKRMKQALTLRRLILKERIELVNINFICLTNSLLWGIYLSGAKIVFTDHSSGCGPTRSLLNNFISRTLHFFIARRVAKYIAVSDYVRERLCTTHHVSDKKTMTLYSGVNLERFKPRDSTEARKKLGLPLESKILCAVAMLIPEKGIQHLIKAADLLVRNFGVKNLLIVIVGDGVFRTALEKQIAELNLVQSVLFLGRRSDVQMVVAAADVVVVPSVWEEAFGLIIAEAMASARPVVASNVGGISELVEDGITGRLVPPADSCALAHAINGLLGDVDERKRMGTAGGAKACREFDLVRQTAKVVDLYETTCGG